MPGRHWRPQPRRGQPWRNCGTSAIHHLAPAVQRRHTGQRYCADQTHRLHIGPTHPVGHSLREPTLRRLPGRGWRPRRSRCHHRAWGALVGRLVPSDPAGGPTDRYDTRRVPVSLRQHQHRRCLDDLWIDLPTRCRLWRQHQQRRHLPGRLGWTVRDPQPQRRRRMAPHRIDLMGLWLRRLHPGCLLPSLQLRRHQRLDRIQPGIKLRPTAAANNTAATHTGSAPDPATTIPVPNHLRIHHDRQHRNWRGQHGVTVPVPAVRRASLHIHRACVGWAVRLLHLRLRNHLRLVHPHRFGQQPHHRRPTDVQRRQLRRSPVTALSHPGCRRLHSHSRGLQFSLWHVLAQHVVHVSTRSATANGAHSCTNRTHSRPDTTNSTSVDTGADSAHSSSSRRLVPSDLVLPKRGLLCHLERNLLHRRRWPTRQQRKVHHRSPPERSAHRDPVLDRELLGLPHRQRPAVLWKW
eukprot:m.310404 g.310404  ORF g.310404 m.310404 type:complete len:464 (+) comp16378_c0_seq8:188-1579(+)